MNHLLHVLLSADETVLIALSNKGTYHRAVREMATTPVQIEMDGDALRGLFGDGTIVEIKDTITNYRCSCPSRSVCKHLLMTILKVQKQTPQILDDDTNKKADTPPGSFEKLLTISADVLLTQFGKKTYTLALSKVKSDETALVEASTHLKVTLSHTDPINTVIYFDASPESAHCSCKSEPYCIHKLQAIFHYIKTTDGDLPASFHLPDDEQTFSANTLPVIRAFVTEVLARGLTRLPNGAPQRFEHLGTLCQSQRLATFKRCCSRIAVQMTLFEKRSAAFDYVLLLDDLTDLLLLCDTATQNGLNLSIAGKFKNDYQSFKELHIAGLGAFGWENAGGYHGVTILFFEPASGEVVTYSTIMPASDRNKPARLYNTPAPWEIPYKLSTISHMAITLKNGKISDKGQLSSSSKTNGIITGTVHARDDLLSPIRYDDYAKLLKAVKIRLETGNTEPYAAIIIALKQGKISFDTVSQYWQMPLYDKKEQQLVLTAHYQESNALLFENLHKLEQAQWRNTALLAQVLIENGRMVAHPITLYEKTPFNLTLDSVNQNKKSTYDWRQLGP